MRRLSCIIFGLTTLTVAQQLSPVVFAAAWCTRENESPSPSAIAIPLGQLRSFQVVGSDLSGTATSLVELRCQTRFTCSGATFPFLVSWGFTLGLGGSVTGTDCTNTSKVLWSIQAPTNASAPVTTESFRGSHAFNTVQCVLITHTAPLAATTFIGPLDVTCHSYANTFNTPLKDVLGSDETRTMIKDDTDNAVMNVRARCPSWGDRRYSVFRHEDITWDDARWACRSAGGRLASPETSNDWNNIKQIVAASGINNDRFWLGATDDSRLIWGASEGSWKWDDSWGIWWIGDQSGSCQPGYWCGFPGWGGGEPNGGLGENCMVGLDKGGKTWDIDCGARGIHAYVCQFGRLPLVPVIHPGVAENATTDTVTSQIEHLYAKPDRAEIFMTPPVDAWSTRRLDFTITGSGTLNFYCVEIDPNLFKAGPVAPKYISLRLDSQGYILPTPVSFHLPHLRGHLLNYASVTIPIFINTTGNAVLGNLSLLMTGCARRGSYTACANNETDSAMSVLINGISMFGVGVPAVYGSTCHKWWNVYPLADQSSPWGSIEFRVGRVQSSCAFESTQPIGFWRVAKDFVIQPARGECPSTVINEWGPAHPMDGSCDIDVRWDKQNYRTSIYGNEPQVLTINCTGEVGTAGEGTLRIWVTEAYPVIPYPQLGYGTPVPIYNCVDADGNPISMPSGQLPSGYNFSVCSIPKNTFRAPLSSNIFCVEPASLCSGNTIDIVELDLHVTRDLPTANSSMYYNNWDTCLYNITCPEGSRVLLRNSIALRNGDTLTANDGNQTWVFAQWECQRDCNDARGSPCFAMTCGPPGIVGSSNAMLVTMSTNQRDNELVQCGLENAPPMQYECVPAASQNGFGHSNPITVSVGRENTTFTNRTRNARITQNITFVCDIPSDVLLWAEVHVGGLMVTNPPYALYSGAQTPVNTLEISFEGVVDSLHFVVHCLPLQPTVIVLNDGDAYSFVHGPEGRVAPNTRTRVITNCPAAKPYHYFHAFDMSGNAVLTFADQWTLGWSDVTDSARCGYSVLRQWADFKSILWSSPVNATLQIDTPSGRAFMMGTFRLNCSDSPCPVSESCADVVPGAVFETDFFNSSCTFEVAACLPSATLGIARLGTVHGPATTPSLAELFQYASPTNLTVRPSNSSTFVGDVWRTTVRPSDILRRHNAPPNYFLTPSYIYDFSHRPFKALPIDSDEECRGVTVKITTGYYYRYDTLSLWASFIAGGYPVTTVAGYLGTTGYYLSIRKSANINAPNVTVGEMARAIAHVRYTSSSRLYFDRARTISWSFDWFEPRAPGGEVLGTTTIRWVPNQWAAPPLFSLGIVPVAEVTHCLAPGWDPPTPKQLVVGSGGDGTAVWREPDCGGRRACASLTCFYAVKSAALTNHTVAHHHSNASCKGWGNPTPGCQEPNVYVDMMNFTASSDGGRLMSALDFQNQGTWLGTVYSPSPKDHVVALHDNVTLFTVITQPNPPVGSLAGGVFKGIGHDTCGTGAPITMPNTNSTVLNVTCYPPGFIETEISAPLGWWLSPQYAAHGNMSIGVTTNDSRKIWLFWKELRLYPVETMRVIVDGAEAYEQGWSRSPPTLMVQAFAPIAACDGVGRFLAWDEQENGNAGLAFSNMVQWAEVEKEGSCYIELQCPNRYTVKVTLDVMWFAATDLIRISDVDDLNRTGLYEDILVAPIDAQLFSPKKVNGWQNHKNAQKLGLHSFGYQWFNGSFRCVRVTGTHTDTYTPTVTFSPSSTGSPSVSSSPSHSPTSTVSLPPTRTATDSNSLTFSVTPPPTRTRTDTATITPPPTPTPTPTITPPNTASKSATVSLSPSLTITPPSTASRTTTPTITEPGTQTHPWTWTKTFSRTLPPTASVTEDPTQSSSLSTTASVSLSVTEDPTQSSSLSTTEEVSLSSSLSITTTVTPAPTMSQTATVTLSSSATDTLAPTLSETFSSTISFSIPLSTTLSSSTSPSPSTTHSDETTASTTISPSSSGSPSDSLTFTVTPPPTASLSRSSTKSTSRSVSLSETVTVTPPATRSSSSSLTHSHSLSRTITVTPTISPMPTRTATFTITPPPTRTETFSRSITDSGNISRTPVSRTLTFSHSRSFSFSKSKYHTPVFRTPTVPDHVPITGAPEHRDLPNVTAPPPPAPLLTTQSVLGIFTLSGRCVVHFLPWYILGALLVILAWYVAARIRFRHDRNHGGPEKFRWYDVPIDVALQHRHVYVGLVWPCTVYCGTIHAAIAVTHGLVIFATISTLLHLLVFDGASARLGPSVMNGLIAVVVTSAVRPLITTAYDMHTLLDRRGEHAAPRKEPASPQDLVDVGVRRHDIVGLHDASVEALRILSHETMERWRNRDLEFAHPDALGPLDDVDIQDAADDLEFAPPVMGADARDADADDIMLSDSDEGSTDGALAKTHVSFGNFIQSIENLQIPSDTGSRDGFTTGSRTGSRDGFTAVAPKERGVSRDKAREYLREASMGRSFNESILKSSFGPQGIAVSSDSQLPLGRVAAVATQTAAIAAACKAQMISAPLEEPPNPAECFFVDARRQRKVGHGVAMCVSVFATVVTLINTFTWCAAMWHRFWWTLGATAVLDCFFAQPLCLLLRVSWEWLISDDFDEADGRWRMTFHAHPHHGQYIYVGRIHDVVDDNQAVPADTVTPRMIPLETDLEVDFAPPTFDVDVVEAVEEEGNVDAPEAFRDVDEVLDDGEGRHRDTPDEEDDDMFFAPPDDE